MSRAVKYAAAAVIGACGFAVTMPAGAQSWPAKPVRLIVNFAPGGTPDIIARVYAPRLGEALGQSVVVENRVGAAGNIGLEALAKSAPDGYTLLSAPGATVVINPHLYKLGIDVAKDIEPVAPTARISYFLVVRQGSPVRNVAELIAQARANPGKLNFGSPGSGTGPHIVGEMLLHTANIKIAHVPYKSGPQVLTALLAGDIDFTFDPGVAVPQIKADKLRLLAVASALRSPMFPDAPTMAEAGMDVDADTLSGIFTPSGTPRDIVMRLNREIGRINQGPETRSALNAIGAAAAAAASPEEFAARLRRDRKRFGVIVRESNIRAD